MHSFKWMCLYSMKAYKRYALVFALSATMPLMLNGCVTAMVAGGTAGTAAIIGSDSRTVDRQMYDEQIEQDAQQILTNDRRRSNSKVFHVDAVAFNGNLLLVGETQDTEYLNWCISEIKKVQYLRKIYNYVQNKPPVSGSVTANDAFITSKVKSALLFGKQINSGRFKVYTEDSVVYLLGYVTKDESIRAINQTRKVSGVKRIVHIFDYLSTVPNSSSNVSVVNDNSSTAQSYQPSSTNSSYIQEPQGNVDNGGAVLLEDDDLLAPAQVN